MRLDVAFTPAEMRNVAGKPVVVVVDVLRATSTMVHALANGARSLLPAASVEEAARRADQLGRDAVLLCGERDAQPIRGFQLGNSPAEFTAERVGGKILVMTTTNGTPALLTASSAQRVLVGSLLNAGAVARRIVELGEDTLLVCAGRDGHFAVEDAICAGRIIRRVQESARPVLGNDAAGAARRLGSRAATAGTLGRTAAGRHLREAGFADDIAFCAQEDLHDVVPILDEHRIRL